MPLFLLKNICGASYKPFYIFFMVPLRGHVSIGILTKTKKWKVECLYFCELQQELHVHIKFLTFSIFQPILMYNRDQELHSNARTHYTQPCNSLKNPWNISNFPWNTLQFYLKDFDIRNVFYVLLGQIWQHLRKK